jgi:hypothetical protein
MQALGLRRLRACMTLWAAAWHAQVHDAPFQDIDWWHLLDPPTWMVEDTGDFAGCVACQQEYTAVAGHALLFARSHMTPNQWMLRLLMHVTFLYDVGCCVARTVLASQAWPTAEVNDDEEARRVKCVCVCAAARTEPTV